jgi:hypothetical protein
LAQYFGSFGHRYLTKQFLEWSAMPDERRAPAPQPHLRTRPATMLTAICLCLLIMIMQLVPEARDSVSRLAATTSGTVR